MPPKAPGARNRAMSNIAERNEKQRKLHELRYTREVFLKFDLDNSGDIDVEEFQHLCEALGYVFADKSEVFKAVSMIDEDANGNINWDEFKQWWLSDDKFGDFQHLLDDSAFYHDTSFDSGADLEVEEDLSHPDYKDDDWPGCLLHPFGLFRTVWDTMTAGAIVYSALFVPYRLAFEIEPVGSDLVLDRVVDCLFIIDIVFSFFTAAWDQEAEVLITEKGEIAKRYLTGWFVPDFMASMPFDLFALHLMNDETEIQADQLRVLKMIRLLRLLKIMRMVKMSRLLTKFQESYQVKSGIMISVKFALITGVTAHYLACAWYVFSTFEHRPWELCKTEALFTASLLLPEFIGCEVGGCPSIDGCSSLPAVGTYLNDLNDTIVTTNSTLWEADQDRKSVV